jgi:hypothetical protein
MADHYASRGHNALRLKEEINRLTEQQTEALKMASFLGMTTAEAKAYDPRRVQITQLVPKLAQLSKGEPSNGASPSTIPNVNPEATPSKTTTPPTLKLTAKN